MSNHPGRSLPWKRVDASLPEPNHEDNHYDNPQSNENQLEAVPGEHVAMFFGLEVLQGHEYTVRNGEFIVVNESVDATTKKCQGEDSRKDCSKKASKKRKASSVDTEGAPDTAAQADPVKPVNESSDTKERHETEKKKKKTKKRKKKESTKAPPDEPPEPDDDSVERMQTSWMIATGGVTLDQRLCSSLLKQDFWMPTPIQSATLPAALLGRRNIVGAAPTGSGKTLAYLLPIFQYLLSQQDARYLLALILTPTRELALQVTRECDKLLPKQCGTIVGGLALQKQERILSQKRPPILVATPGRLWELMSSREHTHLTELSQLRFLVIDEADRMIQQGSFPQLVRIFDTIHDANPMDSDDDENEPDESEDVDDRLLGLPGIPGEAKVQMLDDIMEHMRQQNGDSEPRSMELDDGVFAQFEEDEVDAKDDDDVSLPPPPPVPRQTFVYSATLTLPPSSSYVASKKVDSKKKKNKSRKAVTVEGAIAEILEKARARGQTKVVDLTSSDNHSVLAPTKERTAAVSKESASSTVSSRLPPGLSLRKIECTQLHKDSHLYAYLVTTAQGASGPCLVFCNSIAAVRRVGATLETLRLPVRMLHANMAQKSRFKAVESLREPKSRAIVVATDVAARGLDIPSVATVVHYDVARQVDTFIHRAGRTARGMGEAAVGLSLSLIAPGEDKAHDKVCEALKSKHLFETVHMDGRLLAAAQERANLAAKIVACDEVETKAQKSNKWFQEAAEQAGLDLDDDMLDEGLAGGDQRDQHKLREAKAARGRLRQLLAQPMQTQRFGKFLSSNSAAADPEVAAYVVPLTTGHKKKQRKG